MVILIFNHSLISYSHGVFSHSLIRRPSILVILSMRRLLVDLVVVVILSIWLQWLSQLIFLPLELPEAVLLRPLEVAISSSG